MTLLCVAKQLVMTCVANIAEQRLHSADIIAGGIGVQAVSLLITSGIYFAFVLRLASGKDVQDPKHSNVYLSSRFSIFLRCEFWTTRSIVS